MKYSDMYIRPCSRDDLDAVLALQDAVFSVLPDKSLLRRNTPEILSLGLASPNLTVGVFADEMLVALGMLVDPRPPETDLRTNLQKFTVGKALDMKLVMVHSNYRGKGLQRAMMWICEKAASMQGCTHLCTSVSPDNSFSIRNVLSLDYQFDHLEELYNGLLRNVYVKRISASEYLCEAALRACRYENTPYTDPAIDLSSCIPGDACLSCSGDIAEYVQKDTGRPVYGLIVRKPAPVVLLPDEDNVWKVKAFTPETDGGYILKRIWISTTAHIPFPRIKEDKDNA